jgi:glucose-1-phosphate adenylyltransferase
MHVDSAMRITDFLEKPKDPPAIPGDPDHALASMGIYVFDWAFLRDLLIRDMQDDNSSHDFGFDLIPQIVKHGKAVAHRFSDSCVTSGLETEPYWRDVGTIDAFWQANIDLTDFTPKLDIYDSSWPIWTYAEILPPAKFIHDEDGRRGMAVSSLVSGDCIVSGSEVRNSLLFTGVRTHSFSSLEYVVALPQVTVNRMAQLKNCVIDRGVVIPEGLVIGEDAEEDAKWFRRSEGGIVLITQEMLDNRARALG